MSTISRLPHSATSRAPNAAGLQPCRWRRSFLPFLLLALLGTMPPAARGVIILDHQGRQNFPPNFTIYGISKVSELDRFAVRLLQCTRSTWGQALVNWPQGITPRPLTTLNASFTFRTVAARDGWAAADGFSFNYGGNNPTNRGYNDYEHVTLGSGLTICFQVYTDGGITGETRVYWGNELLAHVGFATWDESPSDNLCRVTYSPTTGLSVYLSYVGVPGSERLICQKTNLVWNPGDNWNFSFQGRTGGDYMNVYIGDISISGSTRPWAVTPDPFNVAEDVPQTFPFPVGDLDDVNSLRITTFSSSNPDLLPPSGVVFGGTGSNRTVTLTPQPNRSGTARIECDLTEGIDTVRYSFGVTVAAVNDSPVVTLSPLGLLGQDSPIEITATVSDVDNNVNDLVVSATSDNQALVPNGNIAVSGAGATRKIKLYPTALSHGTAQIQVKARDPAGSEGTATASAPIAVNAVDSRNYSPTAGRRGYAIRFDGVNDYAYAPASAQLPAGSAMTVEAWVYPEASQADQRWNGLVAWGPRVATGTSFVLGLGSDGRLNLATWGNDMVGTMAPLPFNAWSHVAAALNGRNVKFYVNGSLVQESTLGSTPNVQANVLTIGCTDATPARFFKGKLDEIRLWSRARTAEEIRANYQNRVLPATAGLAAVFSAEEDAGAVLRNGKAGGINAWLLNGPVHETVAEEAVSPEDVVATIPLDGYDPEGRPLTYTIARPPAHGTLTFGRMGGKFKVRAYQASTGAPSLDTAEAVLMDAQARQLVFAGEYGQLNLGYQVPGAAREAVETIPTTSPFPGWAPTFSAPTFWRRRPMCSFPPPAITPSVSAAMTVSG